MKELLSTAENGFRTLPLPANLKAEALSNIELWLTDQRFADYVPAITSMIERGDFNLLVDSFYRMIPFGTGGRRGAVGVGPNRMNPYTLATSVQGHCQFLKQRLPNTPLQVVAACDTRVFNDLRNLYHKPSLGALLGISSRDLCRLAAEVYAANGVVVWMLDPAVDSYLSTPELSFHIYDLKTSGGLNISASHNPPDDNGSKFYNGAGGQEVPPFDEELVNVVSTVADAQRMPFQEAVAQGLIRFISDQQRQRYVAENLSLSIRKELRSATVAFSPLHGVGITSALPVLEQAGFKVLLDANQSAFDGAFSNVPFRIPNPEVPSAMESVISVARAGNAQMALATDPDADRLGLAVPDRTGQWHCLTGNQIGLLLAYYILTERKAAGRLSPSNYMVKTEVTTSALERLTEAFDVRLIGHLLVGFKYIGDVLDQVARTGRWHDFVADQSDFLMAMEESHGLLVSPRIRDKDAANGALLLAELASRCMDQGTTLWELLLEIYKEYGYFGTALRSMIMEGAVGLQNIRTIQDKLRNDPPKRIAGIPVASVFDRMDPQGPFGPIKSQTDEASRDVLVFHLENGVRLILRPSGTEPKNKVYAEFAGAPLGVNALSSELEGEMARVQQQLTQLLADFEVEALALAGIHFPIWATRFSDSLSIDRKRHFIEVLEPEWRLRLSQGSSTVSHETAEELLTNLQKIGPLPMVLPGLHALAQQWPQPAAGRLLELIPILTNAAR